MEYYVALNGDTLEFRKTKPDMQSYIRISEDVIFAPGELPPWYQYRRVVKRVRFLDRIMPVSAMGWFYNFSELEHFDETNLYLDQTTDMAWMFECCSKLQTIDLSGMNVSNVKNFSEIFAGCTNLQSVNLSGWDTRNAETFKMMFYGCAHLLKLDISNLSMESVTDLSLLFNQCQELKEIRLPKIQINRYINMRGMFEKCCSLRKLDLHGFDVINSEWAEKLVKDCRLLTNIRIMMKGT